MTTESASIDRLPGTKSTRKFRRLSGIMICLLLAQVLLGMANTCGSPCPPPALVGQRPPLQSSSTPTYFSGSAPLESPSGLSLLRSELTLAYGLLRR